MITCLHVADLHFGVENYGVTNPLTGLHSRLEDFRDSLAQALDYAIETRVDCVLFAGDAYKRNSPNPTEQRELVRQFCRLADAGIPTVMISGNHDIPVMQGKAASIDIFRTIRPGLFHVYINQPSMKPLILETHHGPLAICALPYISPSYLRQVPAFRKLQGDEFKEAAEGFYKEVIDAMAHAVPEGVPKILVAHLTAHGALLGGYRGSAIMTDEVQILPANLVNAGYDYIALGHIHRHQNLSPREEIPVVYPGSIDRVDFGEAEETKGFVVARIEPKGSTYQFIPLPVRPMIPIRVEGEGDLTTRLLEAIDREPIAGAIVRISFEASDEEMQALDMKQIHAALAPAHFKAGFLRIHRKPESRRRAANLSAEIALDEALQTYLREQAEDPETIPLLMEKAKLIESAVQSQG
ncbi:MAG: exonuclease SbcCD subunit D [bacterium]|jgi:exonuclease SbcD|nr:exonuclease SbcCD subunit D [bacterium]